MFGLKKKKYLDCPFMKHSLHFFYDSIMSCCTNVPGPIFYKDYKGAPIDWNYIYKKRKNYIKHINSIFNKEEAPEECIKCCEVQNYFSEKPVEKFENKIDRLYFHYNMSCNAKCTYCAYNYYDRGCNYQVLPLVKDLIEKDILSHNASIFMSGGEITISPEFEELLTVLQSHITGKIEILSSGIKYCDSIKQAFINNKLILMISLDSSTKETYKKLKQVDCFDKVINNIKEYTSATDNAKENITLKYIIIDGVNDNKDELLGFVHLVKDLGIKNIRLDFDYEKYKYERNIKIPDLYYELYDVFNEEAKKSGLNIQTYTQIQSILDKFRK